MLLKYRFLVFLCFAWCGQCVIGHHGHASVQTYSGTSTFRQRIKGNGVERVPRIHKELANPPVTKRHNLVDDTNLSKESFSPKGNYAKMKNIQAEPFKEILDLVHSMHRKQNASDSVKAKANFYFWKNSRRRHTRRRRYVRSGQLPASGPTDNSRRHCPQNCLCQYLPDNTIDVVDCSNRECREIPRLPSSTRKVYLQNNMIQEVPCGSFTELKSLTTLDLSINLLHVLSICSFTNLTSLKYLWLSHNNMDAFPIGVFDFLQSLIHLDVSYNMINTLNPDLFINTTKLINLNLGNNQLTKIKNHTFQGLSSLVVLSLRYNSLRYLPWTFESKAFQGLASLECLRLEGNQPDFPDNFTYPEQALALVTTLRRLWLDGYPRQLGPGFSQLLNLTQLTITRTDGGFCEMGANIPGNFFSHLATKQPLSLNMAACSLELIPPELFKPLPNIYSLDLSMNDKLLIKGFERGSKGLENSTLTVLNITNIVNSIYIFDRIEKTSFRYLKNTKLKVLIVERCKLILVAPEAIVDLPRTIEYISFRDNKLINGDVLSTITRLTNLKVLIISKQLHNNAEKNATSLALDFSSRRDLKQRTHQQHGDENITFHQQHWISQPLLLSKTEVLHLNITDIHVKSPDSAGYCEYHRDKVFILFLPVHLQEAYASDIKVTYSIPEVHILNNKVLKYFDYSANNVQCLGGPIYGAHSIYHFDLSRNFCTKLNPFFFHYMSSLKTLLLYKNMLGQALSRDVKGITFSSLTNLETLDLSNNVIENLPEALFKSNEHLQVLNLSNNVMSSFRPSLAYNKKLEVLDLSSNLLVGLSMTTCRQLLDIKSSSPNFTTHIGGNHGFLVCDCDRLYFPRFLLDHREIFEGVETIRCHLTNGSVLDFNQIPEIIPQLGDECIAQPVFVVVLSVFLLLMSSIGACALYHFKRWQWKYLYFLSRSRLHIGSTLLSYRPVAHVFLTYDQENRRLRNMMKNVFRPRLNEMGVTTVLGEVDFEAGPREASIAGAVTSTYKTLVFLSADIFEDYYRQLEVNLAIMHELRLRRPVLVPVLLLRDELLTWPGRTQGEIHQTRRTDSPGRSRAQVLDDFTMFQDLLRLYPTEIATFLRGQLHRCLVYIGDTDDFWQHLKRVILDKENN